MILRALVVWCVLLVIAVANGAFREAVIAPVLGAEPRQLLRLAVSRGMPPVIAGLALRLLGAWVASRMLTRFLFEISPVDPSTYVVAVALLTAIAALACYLPARRATRVDRCPS